jgi:molybdopterin-guanine dinucleotide biosynthesis protein A
MILGVILAGGLASRMGGGDKGLRTVGGQPILRRVVDRIGPQVERLVINANGDGGRLADFGLAVVPDDLPDRPGPLAGVLAAMDHAAEMTPCDFVLSVAADCPFPPRDLAQRLDGAMRRDRARIAVAHSGGFAQPTIALWDISLRHDLRRALVDEGLRKIDRFTARYAPAEAEWPVEPYDPFFNANTPDDLALAESIAARYPDA